MRIHIATTTRIMARMLREKGGRPDIISTEGGPTSGERPVEFPRNVALPQDTGRSAIRRLHLLLSRWKTTDGVVRRPRRLRFHMHSAPVRRRHMDKRRRIMTQDRRKDQGKKLGSISPQARLHIRSRHPSLPVRTEMCRLRHPRQMRTCAKRSTQPERSLLPRPLDNTPASQEQAPVAIKFAPSALPRPKEPSLSPRSKMPRLERPRSQPYLRPSGTLAHRFPAAPFSSGH